MPRVNFDEVPDGIVPGDTVPDGTYLARIIGIEPGVTKNGTKWDVWSEIEDGPEKGKRIKDQWLWYGGGLSRTKACISGCAATQEGSADYLPEDFLDMPIFLDVQTTARTGKDGKEFLPECKPRYRGYERDLEREWTPRERPVQPEPKQGNVFDAKDVPF